MNKKITALEIKNLVLSFEDETSGRRKKVIRDTGFTVNQGDVLGIVGESGSGKTVITSAVLGLTGRTARIEKGSISVYGLEVTHFNDRKRRKHKLLGNTITTVFQNPLETLNPNQKVSTQLVESIRLNNKKIPKSKAKAMAMKILEELRFTSPAEIMEAYPFQLSGGMRQRVVIASALLTNPKILVLDEPTTALDPTVEAEIVSIIKEIVKKRKLTVIIITHDLSIIAALATKVAVMYAGKVIETGLTEEIVRYPQHPYTWGLLMSVPDGSIKKGEFYSIPGRAPFDLNNIVGDAFAPRNTDYLLPQDLEEHPPFFYVSKTHRAATWLLDGRAPLYAPPVEILKKWKMFAKQNNIKPSEFPGTKKYKEKHKDERGVYE